MGRMIWCPDMLIKEIEDIMEEDKLEENKFALRELVKYARVGRELNRIKKLDFRRKPLRYELEDYDKDIKIKPKVNPNANGKEYLDKGVINV